MRVAIAALLCLVAACASPSPSAPSVSPSASPVAASSSVAPAASASAPPSASPPAAWLPPWAGPDAPAEVATRSVLPFCGIEQGAGPALTINPEVRGCFLAGYRDGTGAEFASIQTTIEGDPIATIWRTVPGGGVELLVDATQDKFGSGTWMRTTCRQLVNDQSEVFSPDGCDEGVAVP